MTATPKACTGMNRVQFQPGLALTEFLAAYGTEGVCARALRRARWPR